MRASEALILPMRQQGVVLRSASWSKGASHDGRVYAVDVSPDMIRHLHARVRDLALRNVSPILASADDPLLPPPVDRFLIVDVWHHIENQTAYLALMKKQLKPGGQVVMKSRRTET